MEAYVRMKFDFVDYGWRAERQCVLLRCWWPSQARRPRLPTDWSGALQKAQVPRGPHLPTQRGLIAISLRCHVYGKGQPRMLGDVSILMSVQHLADFSQQRSCVVGFLDKFQTLVKNEIGVYPTTGITAGKYYFDAGFDQL